MAPDGTIVINTKINTQGFENGQKKMEAAAQRTASKLKTLNSKLEDVMTSGGAASTFSAPTYSADKYSSAVRNASSSNSQLIGSTNKLRSSIQNTHKDLSKSLKGIMRYAFGIETLFALFRKLRQAIAEGFENLSKYDQSTNRSLSGISSSLTNLKNSLATAFAPILNYITPTLIKFIDLLSVATNYVGMFFAAITGQKSFTKAVKVQNDYASSLGDTTSAANKAKKALENLSGLDEIQKWQSDRSSVSGSSAVDSTEAGNMFETVEVPFEDVDWKFVGSSISDGLINLLDFVRLGIESVEWGEIPNDISVAITEAIEGFDWEGTFYSAGMLIGSSLGAVINFTTGIFREIRKMKGKLYQYFGGYIREELEGLDEDSSILDIGAAIVKGIAKGIRDGIKTIGNWIYKNVLQPFVKGFKDAFKIHSPSKVMQEMGGYIIDGLIVGIQDAFGNISNVLSSIKAKFKNTWSTVKSNISSTWQRIRNETSEKWNSIKNDIASKAESIREKIASTWSNIKSDTALKWEYIKTNLSEKWSSIKINASQRFAEIGTSISNSWTNIKSTVTEKVESLKTSLSNAWKNIKEKAENGFSKLKESVTNIMTSLKNALKTPINGIIGFLNKMLSGLVSGVNSAIEALNKISVTIPSWVPSVGGKVFGFNIKTIAAPQIPYLATGAVIPPNAPFMAMLGDQRSGNNLEAPESLIRQIVREESSSGNTYNVSARANGRTIFEMVIEEGRRRQTTTGRNPFELVY